MAKSELDGLISEIKKSTKQTSINKIDEVRVMKCMLNDPDFKIGVYDRTVGYIGDKCPHEDAVMFVKNIIAGATGLDGKDSRHLAEGYEFTKKDAVFLIDNMRDFINVYSSTGRKINIMQNGTTEANLFTKEVAATNKSIPDRDHPGEVKNITTSPYIKLVSQSKCPKYNEGGKK